MQIYLYGILLASVRLASIFCFRGYKLPVPRSLSSFCLQSNLKIQSVDLTVKDFEESINFYSQILQDQRILKDDQGLFPLSDGAYFKISRSPSVHYEIGEGFIGIGISKDKPTEILPRLVKDASRIIREFGDYKIGPSLIPDEDDMKQTNVRYGIVSDPSGYQVEINESDSQLRKLVLGVIDLDESIEFYTSVLGMNLFRKRSNVNNTPKEASFSGFVGYGETENEGLLIELRYAYGTEDTLDLGSGFNKLVLTATNLPEIIATLAMKGKVFAVNEDDSLSIRDPNGYQIVIVSATSS